MSASSRSATLAFRHVPSPQKCESVICDSLVRGIWRAGERRRLIATATEQREKGVCGPRGVLGVDETYVHVYACMRTCTYIHTHAYMHACMHKYMYTYMRAFIHMPTYLHTYIHTYIHTRIYLFILVDQKTANIHIHIERSKTCVRVCAHACV